jgi:hypothetical protein
VRLADFEALVRRQAEEIPAEFLEGIAEIAVSSRTVSHPERPDVWTLGECIPLPRTDGDPGHLQSRVVLYHGSFQALARETADFDWAEEAWDTLTHEVRHHVEWRARASDLEAFDDAAEANFARQEGQAFDPVFYRDGLLRPDGSYQVDDDVFVERVVARVPERVQLVWGGDRYEVIPPEDTRLPAFLSVEGVDQPPPGELVLVLREKTRIQDLVRRPAAFQAVVESIRIPV